ncbi:hypothetical protein [Actinobacillus delphinicola]|uniref:Autotransporter adhesin n=1 Tax=Actinobacillus delphinicola TaxID=51161 RepID=A0A448TWA1_9PAST|nr:hypothetical protein [Actinobacillus delphinicola]VEJ10189.1 autotransporter adhesin [Actinobacillus delphinicola]
MLGLNVYGNENQSGTTTNGQYLGSSINIIANPANGDIQKDYSTQNLTTVYSQNPQGVGTITVKMKQKPQFQQITLGNGTNKPNTVINQQGVTITPDTKTNPQAQPVFITSGGLDNGGNQIKNVANGIPKGKTLTDAPSSNGATIGDLKHALSPLQNNTITLTGNTGATTAEKLDQKGGLNFKIAGDEDITTSASGNDVTIQLNKDTKAKIDNAADKNLSNITPAGKKVITSLGTIVAQGDNVTVKETEDKTTGQHTYTVSVDKDLKGLDGVHIISGPSMTKSGIDAGNKVITNVAPGKITPDSKDAVNGSQIDSLGKTLGLSPDKNGTGFETPKFTPITQPDGKVGIAPTDYKNAIGNVTNALNKGFIINGNTLGQGTKDGQQYLGSTLNIIGQKAISGVTYSADNLTTVYTKDAHGNGTVLI